MHLSEIPGELRLKTLDVSEYVGPRNRQHQYLHISPSLALESRVAGGIQTAETTVVKEFKRDVQEIEREIVVAERAVEKKLSTVEKELEKDVLGVEKEIEKDVKGLFRR